MDSTASNCSSPALPADGIRGAHAPTGHGHAASVVETDAELLATALPFVEAGLRAGDLVVLACPDDTTTLLCDALGEQAGRVESEQRITLLGSRPPDALATCRRYLERAATAGSGRLRLVAGIDFGSDPADWREGQRFESVFNTMAGLAPTSVICVYDRRRLPEQVVDSAALTHPLLVRGAEWSANSAYRDPASYVPSLPVPRESAENRAPVFVLDDARSLPGLRHQLGAVLAAWVPDREQRDDLHLAVAEIAANAFRHGLPPVSARVWADGDTVVCTIADRGTSWGDPFSGYVPAHGFDLSRGGMGVWLARKLWDHVDVLPGTDGLTVRLSSRLR